MLISDFCSNLQNSLQLAQLTLKLPVVLLQDHLERIQVLDLGSSRMTQQFLGLGFVDLRHLQDHWNINDDVNTQG